MKSYYHCRDSELKWVLAWLKEGTQPCEADLFRADLAVKY